MPVLCNLHATAMGRARARRAGSGGWRECSRMEQVYRDVTVRGCVGPGRVNAGGRAASTSTNDEFERGE